MNASADVCLGTTLDRLQTVYRTGPATVAEKFHLLWDEPSEGQVAANSAYFKKRTGTPAYLKLTMENLVLGLSDTPARRTIFFFAYSFYFIEHFQKQLFWPGFRSPTKARRF